MRFHMFCQSFGAAGYRLVALLPPLWCARAAGATPPGQEAAAPRLRAGISQARRKRAANAMRLFGLFGFFAALAKEFSEWPRPRLQSALAHNTSAMPEQARMAIEHFRLIGPNCPMAHTSLGDIHSRRAARAYGQ